MCLTLIGFIIILTFYRKHEIRKRKANWIGHNLRRNCLLKQVIEGKIKGEIEVTKGRGRRRKKLLDDLKYRRGYSHLKEEALDRTMWRNRFGGGVGPVVRQIAEWMNEKMWYFSTNWRTLGFTWISFDGVVSIVDMWWVQIVNITSKYSLSFYSSSILLKLFIIYRSNTFYVI